MAKKQKKEKDLSELGKEAFDEDEDLVLSDDVDLDEIERKLEEGTEITPEETEAWAVFSQKKARVAQIMSRSVVNDKFQRLMDQSVPEGRVGKFIRDIDDDITRYKNLGYTFEYKEGAPKGLHSDPEGRIRVGDVVLMTISSMDLKILKDIRQDKVKWKLDAGKRDYFDSALPVEEREGGVKSYDDSSQTVHKGKS